MASPHDIKNNTVKLLICSKHNYFLINSICNFLCIYHWSKHCWRFRRSLVNKLPKVTFDMGFGAWPAILASSVLKPWKSGQFSSKSGLLINLNSSALLLSANEIWVQSNFNGGIPAIAKCGSISGVFFTIVNTRGNVSKRRTFVFLLPQSRKFEFAIVFIRTITLCKNWS